LTGQPIPDPRESVLACDGHALVIGGPGSGKTTLALRKARIRAGVVPGQTVLFLSFSRAAVTRVLDAAKLVGSEGGNCAPVGSDFSFVLLGDSE
jgi:superfamily I DNA/RNA helicase